MRVLINSYACSPNWGSEPGLGWNWISHLAKYCELYVITEGEWKEDIDQALNDSPLKDNIHMYYLPETERIREMFHNQGNWRFYYHYKKWQKRVFELAKKICKEQSIDIVHQLNLTCYREPGFLWKLEGVKYVWGPLGGTSLCPVKFIKDIDTKATLKYRIKNVLNWLQFRCDPRIKKAAMRADLIFCDANSGVQHLKSVYGVESLQINESGCVLNEKIEREPVLGKVVLDILWVGRFLPTKLLDLALKTIAKVDKTYNIHFHILGTGNFEAKYKQIAENLGVMERCVWHGQVKHDEVLKIMKSSDLLFYTSVVDGTPAGVMESISNGLPVLCFDTCGFGPMVDDTIGMKIALTNPKQAETEFAKKIEYLYNHRDELQKMSDNCHQKVMAISWDSLTEKVFELYKKVLKNK